MFQNFEARAQTTKGRKIPPRVFPAQQRAQDFRQPTAESSHTVPIQQSDSWSQGLSSWSPPAVQQHSWTPQSSSVQWPYDSGHVQAQWQNTDGWPTQSVAEPSLSSTDWTAAQWQGENWANQSGSPGAAKTRRETAKRAADRGDRNVHKTATYNAQRHLFTALQVHGKHSWETMQAYKKWHAYKTKELMWDAGDPESLDDDYYRYLAFFDMAAIVCGRA